jgi:hypothetical protein
VFAQYTNSVIALPCWEQPSKKTRRDAISLLPLLMIGSLMFIEHAVRTRCMAAIADSDVERTQVRTESE